MGDGLDFRWLRCNSLAGNYMAEVVNALLREQTFGMLELELTL